MKKLYVILSIILGLVLLSAAISVPLYLDYKNNKDRIERRERELSVNPDLLKSLYEGRDNLIKQLKDKPNDFDINSELGVIYMTLGDFNNAEKYLLKAADIAPQNTKAWSNLASIYREEQKYDKARDMYLNEMKNSPRDIESYLGLADMYVLGQGGNTADAISILEQGLRSTDNAEAIQEALKKIKGS